MEQTKTVTGFEAVGSGALAANCDIYPGCPSDPNDKLFHLLVQKLPRHGKHFVRASSQVSAINIAYGASSAGGRAMVTLSGEGWGTIQETMSNMVNAFLPMVVLLNQKAGPGAGAAGHSQLDYTSMTCGAGHGNYRMIVLAPSTVQEVHNLVQLAFFLADKHCNPVIVATEEITLGSEQSVNLNPVKFDPLPEKDWVVKGIGNQPDNVRRVISTGKGFMPTAEFPTYYDLLKGLNEKIKKIQETEVRYETYKAEDADIVLVAYGYSAEVCREALESARDMGIRVGLIRPITLWPFPYEIIKKKAEQEARIICVEDSIGGLERDVNFAVAEKVEIEIVNALDRDTPRADGVIRSDRVLAQIKKKSRYII